MSDETFSPEEIARQVAASAAPTAAAADPEPKPVEVGDDFDLDAWIDGTTGLTETAKIYQRGELFGELTKLERRIEVAKSISDEDRGMDDESPESLRAKWDDVAEQLEKSSLLVYVQDRTASRRQEIAKGLKKNGIDDDGDIGLHILADAIVKVETPDGRVKELPDGFPPNKLRLYRDSAGDNALTQAMMAFAKVTSREPGVSAPLSQGSSSNRGGRT